MVHDEDPLGVQIPCVVWYLRIFATWRAENYSQILQWEAESGPNTCGDSGKLFNHFALVYDMHVPTALPLFPLCPNSYPILS